MDDMEQTDEVYNYVRYKMRDPHSFAIYNADLAGDQNALDEAVRKWRLDEIKVQIALVRLQQRGMHEELDRLQREADSLSGE